MSDDVKLTYRREGELYVGVLECGTQLIEFKDGWTFSNMMIEAHRLLAANPSYGLLIRRADRSGLMPAQLEPQLLTLLRTDPLAYIKANTIPDRVIDLSSSQRTSKLAQRDAYEVPKAEGLRHGLDTLADAFGEVLYAKARAAGSHWIYEHPGTGRWSDLNTIEHWLESHATEVSPVDSKRGWLLIQADLLLKTDSLRFYYPREWNRFGSWISREQLREKLEQFRKDKTNARK